MTPLYWYLGFGVVVLAVLYGANRLTKDKESESLRDLLEAVDRDRERLSDRILSKVVVPVLGTILVVAAWPVAVYFAIKGMVQEKQSTEVEEAREFAVEREHLLERLTVEEIQRREVVTDPLNAVPDLPFGHLNAAWKEFLMGHADDAELWSFSGSWQTPWGRKEVRSGYVMLQNGTPGSYFLTARRNIPDE